MLKTCNHANLDWYGSHAQRLKSPNFMSELKSSWLWWDGYGRVVRRVSSCMLLHEPYNCDVLLLYSRDTGTPGDQWTVLPRHNPDHNLQYFETTQGTDYKPPHPFIPEEVKYCNTKSTTKYNVELWSTF